MKGITPHLWFDKEAQEAVAYYLSVFPNSKMVQETVLKDTPSGDAYSALFELNGQRFMAISAGPYFKLNEAVSFIVNCETQDEIDYYWEKLSAVPASEQCGWCKDKFGLSWQITPVQLGDYLMQGTDEQRARVTQCFLKMKKMDIAELERAFNG